MIFRKSKDGKIPKGAVRVHLYNVQNVLRPRGEKLQKESLSLYIYDRLNGVYENWTNLEYGDNPIKKDLIEIIRRNLEEEVQIAWNEFKENIKETDNIIQLKNHNPNK